MDTKNKVLIIDDSKDLAKALSDVLIYKGFETLAAHSGTEGLNTALSEHPDIILLDLRMPDIDGFEVMRRLRADDWGKNAKIMILTATSTHEKVPEDIVIDKSDFLMKTQWGLENISTKVTEKLSA